MERRDDPMQSVVGGSYEGRGFDGEMGRNSYNPIYALMDRQLAKVMNEFLFLQESKSVN